MLECRSIKETEAQYLAETSVELALTEAPPDRDQKESEEKDIAELGKEVKTRKFPMEIKNAKKEFHVQTLAEEEVHIEKIFSNVKSAT